MPKQLDFDITFELVGLKTVSASSEEEAREKLNHFIQSRIDIINSLLSADLETDDYTTDIVQLEQEEREFEYA